MAATFTAERTAVRRHRQRAPRAAGSSEAISAYRVEVALRPGLTTRAAPQRGTGKATDAKLLLGSDELNHCKFCAEYGSEDWDMTMASELNVDDVSGMLHDKVLATLATYGGDGMVRLSPVWCEWVDGGFNVVVADGDVKARHLKRDDRVSLVIYTNVPPYQGIEIRTRARLSLQDAAAVEERLARKYLGDAKAEAWLATATWDPLLVRLEPGELRVWDLSASGL